MFFILNYKITKKLNKFVSVSIKEKNEFNN